MTYHEDIQNLGVSIGVMARMIAGRENSNPDQEEKKKYGLIIEFNRRI